MYVLKVAVPDHRDKIYVPTRLVVTDAAQVQLYTEALNYVGYVFDLTEQNDMPERPQEEVERARLLAYALLMPAHGTLQ